MSKKTSNKSVAAPANSSPAVKPTKFALLLVALGSEQGATIDELSEATGWQKHSVRGAMSGALKRKGHIVTSSVIDGVRRYQVQSS